MKLQEMIDKRNELNNKAADMVEERDGILALDNVSDKQAARASNLLTDILTQDVELKELEKLIDQEHEYEAIKTRSERAEINAERAAGSVLHMDFARFIDEEVGSTGGQDRIFEALSRDTLEIPISLIADELFCTDEELDVMERVMMNHGFMPDTDTVTRVSSSGLPTHPRDRGVSPLVPPYQMFAFTSFMDIIPKIPTTDAAIRYPKLTWRTTGPAAVTAEGAAATLGNYTVVAADETVREITAMADATKQALRDIPRLRSMLRGALRADARQKMDRMVVGATGSQEIDANNQILRNTAVLNKTEANADVILREAMKLHYKIVGESYKNPNAVCVFGGDWGEIIDDTMDTDKDSYFDGRPMRLFQTPMLMSSAIPSKTVISGAFNPSVLQMFIRQNAQISVGQSGEDFERRQYKMLLTLEAVPIIYEGRGLMKYEATTGNTGGWA